ncbi:MAG: tetratricopeptide repeat protein [Chloroflexota bacterium]
MSEISLKAYFTRLNSLLSANAADEVIQHSRHILESFPKNVTAYRFLGRALVLNGRWQEGRDALRRVLKVYPDDYIAHLGLSEANEHLDRPDEAIWHLERAFEQNPNNKEIIEAIRALYRRYRNVENMKVQMSSAGVARQNVRSGNYGQAIDTLRSARARMNDRLDLKLLLAQVLWDHGTQEGAQEEAAEIAFDVLKVLPDCLEANRIMATLWLRMKLPSDAQRFVNHLEAVDPYLAVEVVQGFPPEDDVFRLDELDYVRTSQSEMASARPDWLQEISSTPAPAGESQKQTEHDDWSSWTSVLLGNQSPEPAEAQFSAEKPMSERFTALSKPEEPIHTGGLTDLFGDPEPSDELAALFETSADASDTEDPMSWLREAGGQTVDSEDLEPSFEDLFAAEEDGPLPEMDTNPMAWLEGSNSDLILDSEQTAQPADAEAVFAWMRDEVDVNTESPVKVMPTAQAAADSGESLDWLQDDHLLDEAMSLEGHLSGGSGAARSFNEVSAFSAATLDGQNDMLDQNQASVVEQDTPAVPGARRGLTAVLQEANFDWMSPGQTETVTSDDEMDDWLNQFGPAQPRPAPTDTPDWLTDLERVTDPDEDEWFKSDESDRIVPVTVTGQADADNFVRLSGDRPNNTDDQGEFEEDDDSDWLAEFASEEAADEEPESDEDLSWMKAAAPTTSEAEMDTGALPDWLSEIAPESAQETPQPQTDYNGMSSTASTPVEEESALSDWLSELEPEEAASAFEPASESEPAAEVSALDDWLAELEPEAESAESPAVNAEDFPWMTADDEDDESASEPTAAPAVVDTGELPDWLSELESASAQTEAAATTVAAEDYSWMKDEAAEAVLPVEPEPAAEAVPADDLDWLSEFEPTAEAASSEPAVAAVPEDEYPWMATEAVEIEAPDEALEPADTNDEPDWLSALEPAAEQPAVAAPADDLDWLAELEPAEPAVAVSADDLDWLAELEPAAEQPAAVPAAEALPADDLDWLAELEPSGEQAADAVAATSEDDYTWMTAADSEAEVDEAEAEVSAVPVADLAWLAELDPASQSVAPVAEVSATADEELAWMAADDLVDDAEDAEVEPATVSEVPDWLSEFEPEAVSAELVAASTEDFAWMAGDESSDDAETAEPAAQFDDAEEIGENEAEFAAVAEHEEHLEPASAHNAPDWLNAMVPGLDVDYEAPEEDWVDDEEPIFDASEREYAWVEQMVEQEMAAGDDPGFAFSRPPAWMASLSALAHDGDADDDLPDWISDDTDADAADWQR